MKMIQFQYDVARNLIYEMTIELTVWKDDRRKKNSQGASAHTNPKACATK